MIAEADVRILRLSHLVLLLICVTITIWGLVFIWQDDMNVFQCNTYLWIIGVPSSFAINLVNMKAYRLASFIYTDATRALGRKLKRKGVVSHLSVIVRTLLMTICTVIILGVISGVDNPKLVKVVTDPLRPKLDYYVCQSKSIGPALLLLLVISHVVISIFCIGPVRNGFGAFRDGAVMKEAFILLYILVLLAYVMHLLGIHHSTVYILRTSFLCIGLLLFVLRILISRCVRHWVSEELQALIFGYFKNVYKVIPGNNSEIMESVKSGNISNLLADDSPLHDESQHNDSSVDDMEVIFADPKRYALFRTICEKGLIIENVNFIEAVAKWKSDCAALVVESSGAASNC